MNKDNKEGRNLEEINKKRILNFGDLSRNQKSLGINVSWDEAWVKCERCNERIKAKWEDKERGWGIGNWKVYLKKAQVRKGDIGYYITGGIKFYCSECDWRHNYWEK
jgi:hypothetical protein